MSTIDEPAVLSEIVDGVVVPHSRRRFLAQLPLLTTAAAVACNRPEQGSQRADTAVASPDGRAGSFNSSSRLDTAIVKQQHATSGAMGSAADAVYQRYDPALPPLSRERSIKVHWRAREVPVRIGNDLVMAAWTFEGDVPGPVLHVRQGDEVEFTLTNEGDVPHSMDFHAAQINPHEAFRSVVKGESVTFKFTARHAGAFMYHCGTAPVLMHIGAGMYGAIIVDPPQPLPTAKEFVLVQSEFYLSGGANGLLANDYKKLASTVPDYVVFNGRPDQYIREPIHVRRGDRVRFHVVSAGPTHGCNFHVVGEIFDAVFPGSPIGTPLRGVQTYAVPPGGGMTFDLIADIPGEFPFVNHGFGHGQKGAIGFLVVEE